VVAVVARWTRPTPEARPAIRFTIALPQDAPMALPNPSSEMAIAPDGSSIAFVALLRSPEVSGISIGTGEASSRENEGGWSGSADAVKALYIRRMDQSKPERVLGGEDAVGPFFSPDSQWVGWFSRGMMKKMQLGGAAPVTICEAGTVYGGAHWAPDGFIYFAPGDLMRVSASGGRPEAVARIDNSKDADYQSPQLLPGGKAVLLTCKPLNITSYDQAVIFGYRLDTHETVTLVEGGSAGMYLSSGHLLYARWLLVCDALRCSEAQGAGTIGGSSPWWHVEPVFRPCRTGSVLQWRARVCGGWAHTSGKRRARRGQRCRRCARSLT
jgi:serine/threonine-protein kinase